MLYISEKKGHPEPEGAFGVAPDIVHLVETIEDVEQLDVANKKSYCHKSNNNESMGCYGYYGQSERKISVC